MRTVNSILTLTIIITKKNIKTYVMSASEMNPDDVFHQMDTNGNGEISRTELINVYMEQFTLEKPKAALYVTMIFERLGFPATEEEEVVFLTQSTELLAAMRDVGILEEDSAEEELEAVVQGEPVKEVVKVKESKRPRRLTHILSDIKMEGILHGAPASPQEQRKIQGADSVLEIVKRASEREAEAEERVEKEIAARKLAETETRKMKIAYKKLKHERSMAATAADEEAEKVVQLQKDKTQLQVARVSEKFKSLTKKANEPIPISITTKKEMSALQKNAVADHEEIMRLRALVVVQQEMSLEEVDIMVKRNKTEGGNTLGGGCCGQRGEDEDGGGGGCVLQ
jgi:hypothetical protein